MAVRASISRMATSTSSGAQRTFLTFLTGLLVVGVPDRVVLALEAATTGAAVPMENMACWKPFGVDSRMRGADAVPVGRAFLVKLGSAGLLLNMAAALDVEAFGCGGGGVSTLRRLAASVASAGDYEPSVPPVLTLAAGRFLTSEGDMARAPAAAAGAAIVAGVGAATGAPEAVEPVVAALPRRITRHLSSTCLARARTSDGSAGARGTLTRLRGSARCCRSS